MLPFQKVHHNKEEASFLNCSSSSLYYTSSSFFQNAIFRVSELTHTPSHTTFLHYFQVSFLGVNISCDNQNWTQNSTNVFYVILNSLYIIYFFFYHPPPRPRHPKHPIGFLNCCWIPDRYFPHVISHDSSIILLWVQSLSEIMRSLDYFSQSALFYT